MNHTNSIRHGHVSHLSLARIALVKLVFVFQYSYIVTNPEGQFIEYLIAGQVTHGFTMFRFSCCLMLSKIWFVVWPLIPRCGESLYKVTTFSIILCRFPNWMAPALARYLCIFYFNVLVRRSIIPNLFPAVKWLSLATLACTRIPLSWFNFLNAVLSNSPHHLQ